MGCRSCAEVSLETFLRTHCGDLTLLGVYLEGQGHLLCRFRMHESRGSVRCGFGYF